MAPATKTGKQRRAISPSLRFEVLSRDGFRCQYCLGLSGSLHVDHVVPVAKGGGSGIDNLLTSCELCNLGKGVQSLVVHPQNPVRAPLPSGIEINGVVYGFERLMTWRRSIFNETALTPFELVHACSLSEQARAAYITKCWLGQIVSKSTAFRKTKVWSLHFAQRYAA